MNLQSFLYTVTRFIDVGDEKLNALIISIIVMIIPLFLQLMIYFNKTFTFYSNIEFPSERLNEIRDNFLTSAEVRGYIVENISNIDNAINSLCNTCKHCN